MAHILRKHKDSREPTSWRQKEIKHAKGRSELFLGNLRKKLALSPDFPAMKVLFAELAREHSDCNASAAKGGDLGFVRRGGPASDHLPSELLDRALRLEPMELSEVVGSPEGVHLCLRLPG